MAIDNQTIQSFFQKQKKSSTDALVACTPRKKSQLLPMNNTINMVIKPLATSQETVSKPLATSQETVSKPLATSQETVSKPLATSQETVSKPLAKPLANQQQKINTEMLVGNEKKLLIITLKKCQMSGSLETPIITTEELKNTLKVEANHLRNIIFRVSNKKLLEIIEFKNGRAGWRRFRLQKDVFDGLIAEESVSKALAKPLANSPSSSSNVINTTTTSESGFEKNLTNWDEWNRIDLCPLSEVGFCQAHLIQIAKQNLLLPEQVQESIYAFAFDLNQNNKTKTLKRNPLDFFMGILRNGSVYAPPSNYKSPKEIALESFVNKQNQIQELEKKAMNLGFENWITKLSMEEKNQIVSEDTRKKGFTTLINQELRAYFKENMWSNMREEIINIHVD